MISPSQVPQLPVNSQIRVDFTGSAETQLWTKISMNLSALRSRRTLPKVNGRSVPWLNHTAACWKSSIKIGRTFCTPLLFFSLSSCHTQTGFSFLSLSLCSKHLMPQQWCATCGSCSWALVSRDPVRLLPPVPAMDICSQRKRRKKMIWGMGRRRAVSYQFTVNEQTLSSGSFHLQ